MFSSLFTFILFVCFSPHAISQSVFSANIFPLIPLFLFLFSLFEVSYFVIFLSFLGILLPFQISGDKARDFFERESLKFQQQQQNNKESEGDQEPDTLSLIQLQSRVKSLASSLSSSSSSPLLELSSKSRSLLRHSNAFSDTEKRNIREAPLLFPAAPDASDPDMVQPVNVPKHQGPPTTLEEVLLASWLALQCELRCFLLGECVLFLRAFHFLYFSQFLSSPMLCFLNEMSVTCCSFLMGYWFLFVCCVCPARLSWYFCSEGRTLLFCSSLFDLSFLDARSVFSIQSNCFSFLVFFYATGGLVLARSAAA